MKIEDIKNIVIKKSKIEGKGIFANRNFKKGEIIIDWSKCSKILSEEEFKKLSEDGKKYVSFIDGKHICFLEPAKYMNHSCEPNTSVNNNCDVAIKDIKGGEEITTDYLKEVPELNVKCNCGSKNCIRIIRSIK